MLSFANIPELIRKEVTGDISRPSAVLQQLIGACLSADVELDPKVISLRRAADPDMIRTLSRIIHGEEKTSCQKQMKRLVSNLTTVQRQLGGWAADHMGVLCMQKLAARHNDQNYKRTFDAFADTPEDVNYISSMLSEIKFPPKSDFEVLNVSRISPKVETLLEVIQENFTKKLKTKGIIFVRERATAVMLAKTLEAHPNLRTVRAASFVGEADSKESSFADINDSKVQRTVLRRFHDGDVNLLVATSALEEGIDVPACNLVICFQAPPEVRSFIQRRGRARHMKSKLFLFDDIFDEGRPNVDWLEVERLLQQMYENRLAHESDEECDDEREDSKISVHKTG